jgi:hypothetical protein
LIGAWQFVVGDDWRIALGVMLALGATALVAEAGSSAWWVMPLAVVALLGTSIRGSARAALARRRAARRRSPNASRFD